MKFEKSDLQKSADYIAKVIQNNIQTLNRLSNPPFNIDIIETGWGNRYISLKDVYKLLDDRFDEHHEIKWELSKMYSIMHKSSE